MAVRVPASVSLRPLSRSGTWSLPPWLASTVRAARRKVSSGSLARAAIRASISGMGLPSRLPFNSRMAFWRVLRSSDCNCSCSLASSSGLKLVCGGGGGGGARALSRSAPSSICQLRVRSDRRLRFSVTDRVLHSSSTRFGSPRARSNSIRPSPVALTRGSEPLSIRESRLIVFCNVTASGVASATLILVFCRAASTLCAGRPGE